MSSLSFGLVQQESKSIVSRLQQPCIEAGILPPSLLQLMFMNVNSESSLMVAGIPPYKLLPCKERVVRWDRLDMYGEITPCKRMFMSSIDSIDILLVEHGFMTYNTHMEGRIS